MDAVHAPQVFGQRTAAGRKHEYARTRLVLHLNTRQTSTAARECTSPLVGLGGRADELVVTVSGKGVSDGTSVERLRGCGRRAATTLRAHRAVCVHTRVRAFSRRSAVGVSEPWTSSTALLYPARVSSCLCMERARLLPCVSCRFRSEAGGGQAAGAFNCALWLSLIGACGISVGRVLCACLWLRSRRFRAEIICDTASHSRLAFSFRDLFYGSNENTRPTSKFQRRGATRGELCL